MTGAFLRTFYDTVVAPAVFYVGGKSAQTGLGFGLYATARTLVLSPFQDNKRKFYSILKNVSQADSSAEIP